MTISQNGLSAFDREENETNGSTTPSMDSQSSNIVDEYNCNCNLVANEKGVINARISRRKLIFTIFLCGAFIVAEMIGGVGSNSLAIFTDAMHLLGDMIGLGINAASLTIAQRPASRSMTFGWHRAKVMGAMISVLITWSIAGVMLFLGINRIVDGTYEINATVMLITSSFGIAIGLVMLIQLLHVGHGHSHGAVQSKRPEENNAKSRSFVKEYGSVNSLDGAKQLDDHCHRHDSSANREPAGLNVRAALVNVFGDLCHNVGVMIAALVVYFEPTYKIVDPLCTFTFSIIVFVTSFPVLRDVFTILMEGMPRQIDYQGVKSALSKVQGINGVHKLRIWGLSESQLAITTHVVVDNNVINAENVISDCQDALKNFPIVDLTIQVEQENTRI